jgi:CheY-like chemotaxis protein
VKDYLSKIKVSGSLLLDLVNDTLMLSRIESGKMVINPDVVDFNRMIHHITVPIRANANVKGIQFELETVGIPANLVLHMDRLNTQKIFLNLLGNAIKFTPEGGSVLFRIEAFDNPEFGTNYRFTVKDTGIGIGKDFLSKLYEPFTQEHASDANSLGTGLGLSIVKQLINLMGGRITVQSEVGRGTEFTVYLYFEIAQDKAKANRTLPNHSEDKDLRGKKILLCEDNYLNTEIAKTVLEMQGLLVTCAANGKIGSDIFAASMPGEYDAILMDLRMPVMDGYEATEAIRKMNRPDAKTVPIIALTADVYEKDKKKTTEMGMNGHVSKPLDPAFLFSELRRLCK